MTNSAVPHLYALRVQQNNLVFNVLSDLIADRRMLIEFPNAACNLIYSPNYYQKYVGACYEGFLVSLPFATCGFTKTSLPDQDVYKGEVHVKTIDFIPVDDKVVERVIDTPYTLVIRLPKNIAVSLN